MPADEVAQRFAKAVDAADGSAFGELLDTDALAARVLGDSAADAEERDRHIALVSSQLLMLRYSLAGQFSAGRAKASVRPPVSGQPLVRVTSRGADGALSHTYLRLRVTPDGRIEDWYDYGLAMSMSEQLRFTAAHILPRGSHFESWFGNPRDAGTAAKFDLFTTYMNQRDVRGAFEVLAGMPEDIRATRAFATLRLSLARHVGVDEYRSALEHLVEKHGEADELQLLLVDHYLLKEDYESLLTVLDRLERQLGADEVLHTNRCAALIGLERFDAALAACDHALAINPAFDTALWTRVRLGLTRKDADLVVASLLLVEKSGEALDLEALSAKPAYAWVREQVPFRRLMERARFPAGRTD